jgi:hypothetical protein
VGHIRPLSHSDEAKLILAALKPARLQPVGPLQNLSNALQRGRKGKASGRDFSAPDELAGILPDLFK